MRERITSQKKRQRKEKYEDDRGEKGEKNGKREKKNKKKGTGTLFSSHAIDEINSLQTVKINLMHLMEKKCFGIQSHSS